METSYPVISRVADGIAYEIIDRLRKEKLNPGAAPQAFLGKKDVRSASSAANREIACADLPLFKLLRNPEPHGFSLGLGKTRPWTIPRIDHVPTANRNLIVAQ